MGMTKTLARTGLTAAAVLVGVLNGSPLVVPLIGLLALTLYRLVDYGARETERALELASGRRIAEITWQLQAEAAHLALQARRLHAETAPLVHPRAYDDGLLTPPGGLPLLCGYAA